MSPKLPFTSQDQPEVWLVLDDSRVLARLRAGGPSWLHVFIDGPPPDAKQIPFTVVLRGVDGGVVDGVSELMSSVRRDGRTVLHLRLIHLTTSGRHERLLRRFLRDVLRRDNESVEGPGCFADDQTVRAIHLQYRTDPVVNELLSASAGVSVDQPVLWRSGAASGEAEILRSSASGRRLVVRRRGAPPSAWETIRLEFDLGCDGEPRPVQLVGMVMGTLPPSHPDATDVVIRLTRWARDSDRVVWRRWVRHQCRLEAVRSRVMVDAATRTIDPRSPAT